MTILEEDGRSERVSLAALLARLLNGPEVGAFPRLGAEQHGYWWRFLVRCAAKALHEMGATVEDAARRANLADAIGSVLRDAVPQGGWMLWQPDAALPGFLQPPTPDGQPPEGQYAENTLRLLTGALGIKNHERKFEIGGELDPEQAIYALVEFQSGAIFGGRGNYASQLMGSASGAGSGTPFMGARVGGSNVATFRHDVAVLLGRWSEVASGLGLKGPVWALWAEAWDGKTQLPSTRLDPAFIPLARMVRLGVPDEDGTYRTVWFRPSDKARVDDASDGGLLGDPFTPLVSDEKSAAGWKVRGTLGKGYDYTEVAALLLEANPGGRAMRLSPSVQALLDADDGTRSDLSVLFQGVAYEQGKTGGFHRREVLLPAGAADFFHDAEPLRETHGMMLERVKSAKSALRGAARIFVSGAPKPRDGDAARVDLPAAALEARVDAAYLDALFANAARHREGDAAWEWAWGERLREMAREAFREALPALPGSLARRYQRETEAWGYLENKLYALADPNSVMRASQPAPEPEEVPA